MYKELYERSRELIIGPFVERFKKNYFGKVLSIDLISIWNNLRKDTLGKIRNTFMTKFKITENQCIFFFFFNVLYQRICESILL